MTRDFRNLGTRFSRDDMLAFAKKSDLLQGHSTSSSMKHALKNGTTLLLLLLALASTGKLLNAQAGEKSQVWIATWGASQQIPESQNSLPPDDLRDATVRQICHLSASGAEVRVHLSNAFGTQPLHFTSVHIARPLSSASSAIDPATDRALTFAGASDVIVPPGSEFVSDPVAIPVAALSNLAVTFHLDTPPAQQTGHPGSRATSSLCSRRCRQRRQSHRREAR